jgi:nicotinate-nucleotide adenylyltransferase
MKIGLFGGTFDPIHVGHLIVAETIRSDFGLDLVLFVPASVQPLKSDKPAADAESRFHMVELAVENREGFSVSNMEIQRGGVSYTLDTLKSFHQSKLGQGNAFYWIVGMDSLIDMKNWKKPEAIFELATLLVAARPGYDDSMVESWIKVKAVMVSTPLVDISSTEIRKRVRGGKSIRFWVPDRVADTIAEKGLYR